MEDKLNELSVVNALIFGVLIAVSYYVLFYHPSNPELVIAGLDESISTVKSEISRMDREIKEGELLKQELQALEIKAEKIYKYIPENLSIEQASGAVSEEARLAGLSIESIGAGQSWLDKETVSIGSVNVNVQGEFNQIMVFLSELTRKDILYSIKKVQINDRSETERGLALTAEIDFFRRFEKQEQPR